MIPKKFDFSHVRLRSNLRVDFHSVAVKDTSCTVRLLGKFELPARASNKICLTTNSTLFGCGSNYSYGNGEKMQLTVP